MSSERVPLPIEQIIDIILDNDLTTTGQLVDFFLSDVEYRPLFRHFTKHYDFFRAYLFTRRCEKELLNE